MQKELKPSKELRILYQTDYPADNVFASRARLLQSIWRAERGYDAGGYGNYLELNFAKSSQANFLTQGIKDLVINEIANKGKEGKVIKEPRIWDNLLSSQPLAFNLFGELKLNLAQATKVFADLFPERQVKSITGVEFEYSPGRRNNSYTGDASAFDVFLTYISQEGKKGFLGFEVKYYENLGDAASTHKDSYERISRESGVVDMSNLDKLRKKPVQQIWRDHLLALSMFLINNDYDIEDFVYLYPSDNVKCQIGTDLYRAMLSKNIENYFRPLTMEKFVAALKRHCKEKWVEAFEDRYLDFDKVKKKEEAIK